MFGVALDIKLSDFKRILKAPKVTLVGLFSEYIVLPILTLILVFIFRPHPSLALGMILIACCPGGSTSNFMVHLARANAALSVILTSITTIGAVIVTPLAFAFWSSFVPESSNIPELVVEPAKMVSVVFKLIFVPVCVGVFLNEKYPDFTQKVKKIVSPLSLIVFLSFVVGALYSNWDFVQQYLTIVFGIVLVHNALAFLVGYLVPSLFRLSQADTRAIAIETGIQNTGLGLILTFNFFDGLGGMAMILAWWGVWHLISGFSLAMWWKRSAVKTMT